MRTTSRHLHLAVGGLACPARPEHTYRAPRTSSRCRLHVSASSEPHLHRRLIQGIIRRGQAFYSAPQRLAGRPARLRPDVEEEARQHHPGARSVGEHATSTCSACPVAPIDSYLLWGASPVACSSTGTLLRQKVVADGL